MLYGTIRNDAKSYAKSESLRSIICNITFIIKIKTLKVATKLSETQT